MKNDKRELELFKEAQRRKAFSSGAGAYVPHVYLTFNDPDFRNDLQELKERVEALYKVKGWDATEESKDSTLEAATRLVQQVADKYRISIGDLTLCADGSFDVGGDYGTEDVEYGGISWLPFEASKGKSRLIYMIGPKTTLKQIERDWPLIQGIQKMWLGQKSKRARSSNDPRLTYAIFKAHELNGLSYGQIYKLYENKKLPGYENGSTKQYNSTEEIKKFYHRHAPAVWNNSDKYPNLPVYVRH